MNKIHPREELLGKRLVLRKHDSNLADTMYEYVDRDRARLRLHLPWVDLTRSAKDEENYIEMTAEAWKNHTLFDYGLFRKDDGVYMGNAGVHTIRWQERRCEVGYWILSAFEGKGYMSEAVCLLEDEMFRLGFERIEIRCNSKNERSASIPRRNGYRLEKVIRKEEAPEDRRDTFVFAKSRDLPFQEAADLLVGAGAGHVVHFTSDMTGTRDFLIRAFGAKPVLDQTEICEFKIGLQSLILQPPDASAPAGTSTEMTYWPVGEFETALKRFLAAGGELIRGPIEIGLNERICQIRDPAGNVFGLRGHI